MVENSAKSGTCARVHIKSIWAHFLAVSGPGLVVMLADTDAGSIITASQSGAVWGYRLLALQFALIPVLFIVQELTVRLGIVTGKGHAQLIEENYGPFWAWASTFALIIACIGALLSELSGLVGVGTLFGIEPWKILSIVVVALTAMAISGSYRTVEGIAVAIGVTELCFIVVAYCSRPHLSVVMDQAFDFSLRDPKFLLLASANIGAVIMPWMVFYQQSAVVEKGLKREDLTPARWDTAIGAVISQIIMAAALVAAASALYVEGEDVTLDSAADIAKAFTPVLGHATGTMIFAMGMTAASLIAAIVVTLTAARTMGEMLKIPNSLNKSITEAPWFYLIYAATLIISALIVGSDINLVDLNIYIQVMNALMLPFVLGFLVLLAHNLPEPYGLRGAYAFLVYILLAGTCGFALYSSIAGLM